MSKVLDVIRPTFEMDSTRPSHRTEHNLTHRLNHNVMSVLGTKKKRKWQKRRRSFLRNVSVQVLRFNFLVCNRALFVVGPQTWLFANFSVNSLAPSSFADAERGRENRWDNVGIPFFKFISNILCRAIMLEMYFFHPPVPHYFVEWVDTLRKTKRADPKSSSLGNFPKN